MNTQTKNNTYCQFWMKTGNYSSAFFFMSQNALRLMLHIFIYRHNFFTAFLIKKVHTIYDLYELSFDKWYVSIRNCYASAVQVLVIVELMKQPCLQFTEQALAYILCKPWDWKKKKKPWQPTLFLVPLTAAGIRNYRLGPSGLHLSSVDDRCE